jgi:hypothetical protein
LPFCYFSSFYILLAIGIGLYRANMMLFFILLLSLSLS